MKTGNDQVLGRMTKFLAWPGDGIATIVRSDAGEDRF
jgi:hypothetical protein